MWREATVGHLAPGDPVGEGGQRFTAGSPVVAVAAEDERDGPVPAKGGTAAGEPDRGRQAGARTPSGRTAQATGVGR